MALTNQENTYGSSLCARNTRASHHARMGILHIATKHVVSSKSISRASISILKWYLTIYKKEKWEIQFATRFKPLQNAPFGSCFLINDPNMRDQEHYTDKMIEKIRKTWCTFYGSTVHSVFRSSTDNYFFNHILFR